MREFIREKIDSITQIEPKQITRDNLRLHYGTGQEIVTKNSQGNKPANIEAVCRQISETSNSLFGWSLFRY